MKNSQKRSPRAFMVIALLILLFASWLFGAHMANGATFSGMCSATNGYVVGKQCRWPLRISQTTTRRVCKSMGGTFFLAQKYQGCSR